MDKTLTGIMLWITGLSGAGKSTIAEEVYKKLKTTDKTWVWIDGDQFREIISNDLLYTYDDRIENARRIHRFTKFLIDQNINVVVSTMSLYSEVHMLNESIKNRFIVFVECDMEELILRDQKGIYTDFTRSNGAVVGVDVKYDMPKYDIKLDNSKKENINNKTDEILHAMWKKFGIATYAKGG